MSLNKGVFLNGRNAYIEIVNSETLNFSKLTIFFRFKARPTYSWRYILAKATGASFASGWTGWRFNTGIDGTVLNFDLSESSANYKRLYGQTVVIDNKWHEVLGWWDGTNCELWIDGELKDSGTFSGDISNTLPIVIGATSAYSANTHCIFDYLLIWNRALTDTEKQQLLYGGTIPTDGLVIHIPFSENMGVVCKDRASGLYGRMYNCRWVSRARRGMYFDNGGIKFDSRLNIDCNYCSVVAVFAIETLNKGVVGSNPNYGRNCIVRFSGDKLLIHNDWWTKKVCFANYDGKWKGILSNIDLESGQVYTVAGIMNNNEEHIYLASNGVIIDHNYRDDLGDCGEYTDSLVYVGSTGVGTYLLHGEGLATMIYNRPITEDEIRQISEINGWFDPPRDGLISWILFDGLKEGDTPVDLITGAEGVQIGTPKFVIRKPYRVLKV